MPLVLSYLFYKAPPKIFPFVKKKSDFLSIWAKPCYGTSSEAFSHPIVFYGPLYNQR